MTTPSWHDDIILEPDDATISIADVETGGVGIISQARLMLVTNGSWTEPSADLFRSPATASGVFFDILMTRIDADTLEFRVRDYLGATLITRRIDIEAAGNTTINFYCGTSYLWIFARRATAEGFVAALLDPEGTGGVDADHPNRLIANAHRSTGGVVAAIVTGIFYAFHAGVATLTDRTRAYYYNQGRTTNIGPASRELYPPMYIMIPQAAVNTWQGVIPGVVMGPGSTGVDTLKNIPVDTGTKLAFIYLPPATVGTYTGKTLVRKPSVDP